MQDINKNMYFMPEPKETPHMKTELILVFFLVLVGIEDSRVSGPPGAEGAARGPPAAVFCRVPGSCIRTGTASSPVSAAGSANGQAAS